MASIRDGFSRPESRSRAASPPRRCTAHTGYGVGKGANKSSPMQSRPNLRPRFPAHTGNGESKRWRGFSRDGGTTSRPDAATRRAAALCGRSRGTAWRTCQRYPELYKFLGPASKSLGFRRCEERYAEPVGTLSWRRSPCRRYRRGLLKLSTRPGATKTVTAELNTLIPKDLRRVGLAKCRAEPCR